MKEPYWIIAICLPLALLFAWLAISGVLTGEVQVAYKNCDPCVRTLASDPNLFWRNVGLWAFFSVFFLALCTLPFWKKSK